MFTVSEAEIFTVAEPLKLCTCLLLPPTSPRPKRLEETGAPVVPLIVTVSDPEIFTVSDPEIFTVSDVEPPLSPTL